MNGEHKKKHKKLTAGLLAAWFVFSLSASALYLFRAPSNQLPVALALAALLPVILFLVWFARSEAFRQFTLSLNPRTLTLAHAWRINGWIFVALYAIGLLPAVFAQPAGWGDMFIGATAPLVAWKLASAKYRGSFIAWHMLGIADLVAAVTLGATARFVDPHGVSTDVMSVLPMSLVPTFFVPLLLILHIISIAQAKQWREAPVSYSREPFASSHA